MIEKLMADFDVFCGDITNRKLDDMPVVLSYLEAKRRSVQSSWDAAVEDAKKACEEILDQWLSEKGQISQKTKEISDQLQAASPWPAASQRQDLGTSEQIHPIYKIVSDFWKRAEEHYGDQSEDRKAYNPDDLLSTMQNLSGAIIPFAYEKQISPDILNSVISWAKNEVPANGKFTENLDSRTQKEISNNAAAKFAKRWNDPGSHPIEPSFSHTYEREAVSLLCENLAHELKRSQPNRRNSGYNSLVKDLRDALNAVSRNFTLLDFEKETTPDIPSFSAEAKEAFATLSIGESYATEVLDKLLTGAEKELGQRRKLARKDLTAAYPDLDTESDETIKSETLKEIFDDEARNIVAKWTKIANEIIDVERKAAEAELSDKVDQVGEHEGEEETGDQVVPDFEAAENFRDSKSDELIQLIRSAFQDVQIEVLNAQRDQFKKFASDIDDRMASLSSICVNPNIVEERSDEIHKAVESENESREESVAKFAEKTAKSYEETLLGLSGSLLIVLVVPNWLTNSVVVEKDAHIELKARLSQFAKLGPIRVVDVNANRQTLRILSEWVAIGAVTRVIDGNGHAAYYPGTLLYQLDDESLMDLQ